MKTFSELRTLNERTIVEKKATTYIEEGAEVYTMKKGPYTRKVDGKEADKMKRQGWKLMMRETLAATANLRDITGFDPDFGSMKESVEEGKKPVSQMTPAEKAADAKRRKEYNAFQKSKRNESVDLEEGKMKEFHGYIDQGKSAQWIAKKMGLDMKTVKALMDDIKESTDLSEAIDFEKMSKELLKHKSKGIEFEKAAAFVRVMFMNSASSVQDKAMKGLLDLLKNMDDLTKKTTITKILKDNGFKVKGGRIMREESVQEAKDDDYRRLTHAIKTTPKHRRDKVAMASQPAKTDLKAVARRKAIEKHQERMRAKKDSY